MASGFARSGYAVVKAVAFTLLALGLGLRSGDQAVWHSVWVAGSVFTWVSLAMCILRGQPVVIEAPALFQSAEFQVTAPPVLRE